MQQKNKNIQPGPEKQDSYIKKSVTSWDIVSMNIAKKERV